MEGKRNQIKQKKSQSKSSCVFFTFSVFHFCRRPALNECLILLLRMLSLFRSVFVITLWFQLKCVQKCIGGTLKCVRQGFSHCKIKGKGKSAFSSFRLHFGCETSPQLFISFVCRSLIIPLYVFSGFAGRHWRQTNSPGIAHNDKEKRTTSIFESRLAPCQPPNPAPPIRRLTTTNPSPSRRSWPTWPPSSADTSRHVQQQQLLQHLGGPWLARHLSVLALCGRGHILDRGLQRHHSYWVARQRRPGVHYRPATGTAQRHQHPHRQPVVLRHPNVRGVSARHRHLHPDGPLGAGRGLVQGLWGTSKYTYTQRDRHTPIATGLN